jgi:predicted amidophosphoribosyltransferase
VNVPRATGNCPVCQARFRGERICSRCGADLARVMQWAVASWRSREAARCAIEGGDYRRASRLALDAERLQRTPCGGALLMLATWLEAIVGGDTGTSWEQLRPNSSENGGSGPTREQDASTS